MEKPGKKQRVSAIVSCVDSQGSPQGGNEGGDSDGDDDDEGFMPFKFWDASLSWCRRRNISKR